MNTFDYNNKQQTLLPYDLRDLIPFDDPVLIIDKIIESLDLSELYVRVPSEGHPSYHPLMMLKILFFAYIEGEYSSRKIMKRVQTDIRFLFLSAFQKPDFRTISDFRKNNLDLLPNLFNQILYKCFEAGLIKFEHVSIDATVIKANASKHKSYNQEQLNKSNKKLYNQISSYFKDSIKKDLDEDGINNEEEFDKIINKLKKYEQLEEAQQILDEKIENKPKYSKKNPRVNLTDDDSSVQRNSGGMGFVQGYRGVFSVDKENQIILDLDVASTETDNAFTQSSILRTMTIKNQFSNNAPPETKFTLDAGFFNSDAIKNLELHPGVDTYIPDNYFDKKRKDKKINKFDKQNFKYDSENDEYICPEGKRLKLFNKQNVNGKQYSYYMCSKEDFDNCPFRDKCTKSKRGRRIGRDKNQEIIDYMREKLTTENGKEIYRKRQFIIEPVFGDLKFNNKFSQFYLRGKDNVLGELYLLAIAKNLKKLARYIGKNTGNTSVNLQNIINLLNIFINSFYSANFINLLN